MSIILIASIAVTIAFIGSVVVFAVHAGKKQQSDATARAGAFAAIGAHLGGSGTQGGFAVNLGDQQFTAQITTHKGNPTGFVLTTYVDDAARDPAEAAGSYRSDPMRRVSGRPRLLLRRETGRDRFGKRLRINREVQTGDAAFDAAMYLESDAPDEDVRAMLADERVRRGAIGLIETGYHEIVINDGATALTAKFSTNRPDQQDPTTIRGACELLRQIAGGLPAFTTPGPPPQTWWRGVLAVIGAVLSVIFGFVAHAWARPEYLPIDSTASWTGVLLGFGAVALLVLPLGMLVRGRSGSFRAFLAAFGFMLVGLPLSGAGLAVWLNGALDEAPPIQRRTKVVRKDFTTSKNSKTYYVYLHSWREDGEPVKLPVRVELYIGVSKGTEVIVTTGPGRFGWEWRRAIARAAR